MPNFTCEKCHKTFTKKSNYVSHLMRKNPCVKNNNIDYQCLHCNKSFPNKYNLTYHITNCKIKNLENKDNIQLEELKKENEALKKKVDELSHKETNNITVADSNNNNNNINNVINIYSAGKEDLTKLSQEDIIKLCTSGTYYPIVAAEILHCNENYPEFQNYLISNMRSSTGLIRINNNWVTKSQNEILDTLMNVDKKHISNLIKNLEVEKKLLIKLASTKNEIDDNECKEHQKTKIKNALHTASKMIAKNKNISDNNSKMLSTNSII